jgi:hypothetical protein
VEEEGQKVCCVSDDVYVQEERSCENILQWGHMCMAGQAFEEFEATPFLAFEAHV